jgi:hypothetical protein
MHRDARVLRKDVIKIMRGVFARSSQRNINPYKPPQLFRRRLTLAMTAKSVFVRFEFMIYAAAFR